MAGTCRGAAGTDGLIRGQEIIGGDSAAHIMMMPTCRSTSPPCRTIQPRCSRCCARWWPGAERSRDREAAAADPDVCCATSSVRRSEKLTADQLQLGLEDLEQDIAANEAAQDEKARSRQAGASDAAQRNHGALPSHLPRYEVVIDVEPRDCPCCGGALHVIGELRSEQLDIVPAQLRVRVTRRPRYACRTCERAVVVAPAPERPIDGGMATEALVVHVMVSKFCELAAAVPAVEDAGAAGHRPGSLDTEQLGWPRLLVADAAL